MNRSYQSDSRRWDNELNQYNQISQISESYWDMSQWGHLERSATSQINRTNLFLK